MVRKYVSVKALQTRKVLIIFILNLIKCDGYSERDGGKHVITRLSRHDLGKGRKVIM